MHDSRSIKFNKKYFSLLKNQLKNIQKTPNKEFKKVNLKMPEDGSTVKGKVGKKNYKKETKRYHQAHKRMGLIKD